MDNKISVFKDNSGNASIKRDKLEEFLKGVKSDLVIEHISGNESASVQKIITLAIACQKLFNELEEIKASNVKAVNTGALYEALKLVREAHYVTCDNNGDESEGFEPETDDGTGRPLICVVESALAEPVRNCDVYLAREQAKEAYDRALSKNMQERLSNNDTVSEFPEYEDWLFELYNEEHALYSHKNGCQLFVPKDKVVKNENEKIQGNS